MLPIQLQQNDQSKPLNNELDLNDSIQSQNPYQSSNEFITHYNNFFQNITEKQTDSQLLAEIIKIITSNQIDYDPQQEFQKNIHVRIVNHSIDYQILELEIKMGYFTFKNIKVLNINKDFPANLAGNFKSGSFANVFKINFNDQFLALKTIRFERNFMNQVIHKDIGQKLQLLLKEYCLTKLASLIQVGPKTNQMDCAAFPMEYCQEVKPWNKFNDYCNCLKEQIKKLHVIKFVHFDIKEENICYNSKINKLLFIDYGLSKILKQNKGYKTLTYFFGTLTYCSEQLNSIFLSQKSDYIDLYYNDVICLQNTFKNQNNKWKDLKMIDTQATQDECLHPCENKGFQKTLVIPYIKYLAYQLKFQEFQFCVKKNWNLIKKIEFDEIVIFMKRMSLSINNFLFFKYTSKQTKSIYFQNDYSSFSSQQNEIFNKEICKIINHFNEIPQINKTTKNFNPILYKIDLCLKLNWRIYVKQLVKAIQINNKNCKFQQKLNISKISKILLSKNFIPQIKMCLPFSKAKYENDLQEVSSILFAFSLSGILDNVKITIFYSIIYNVILLELYDLQTILQIYQIICLMKIDFNEKMRMLLKIKSLILWKYFQIHQSLYERIKIVKNFIDFIRKNEEQFCQSMTQPQKQFFKIISMNFIYINNKLTKTFLQKTLKSLQKQQKYKPFLLSKPFSQQLSLWFICNICFLDNQIIFQQDLQKIIIKQSNKIEICYDYYHFVFMPYRKEDQKKLIWVVDLFLEIFQGVDKIQQKYRFDIIKLGMQLEKNCYKDYNKFFTKIQEENSLQKIHPSSIFGKTIHQKIHNIILNKSINSLPTKSQKIYLQSEKYLIKYQYNFHEEYVEKFIFFNFENLMKEKIIFDRKQNMIKSEKDLLKRWTTVYKTLKSKIFLIKSKKIMNFALTILYLILSQILSLKKLQLQQFQLIKKTIIIIESMQHQQQIYTQTRQVILYYFMKIITCSDFRTTLSHKLKKQLQIIYIKFYQLLSKRKQFYFYLQDRYVILQIYSYLIFINKQKSSTFINQLSISVIKYNSLAIALNFYMVFNMAIRVAGFRNFIKYAHINGEILSKLDRVQNNPYIGVYLHTLMSYQEFWGEKNFMKICNSFKYIHHVVIRLILENYYTYIFGFYNLKVNQRKRKFILLQSFKYQKKNIFSMVLDVTLGKESRLRNQRGLVHQCVKGKIRKYYIQYNINRQSKDEYGDIFQEI